MQVKPKPVLTAEQKAEARTKITKARIQMIMRQPFFGTLALRLQVVEDENLNPPTMAVDGRRMFYHPKWVLDNDQDIVMSAVAHEVGHCVFQHIGRRNGREPRRWNHAGDYVINAVLKDAGFVVPDTWLFSPSFAGQSTDQIYQQLPPDPPGEAFDEIGNGDGGESVDGSDGLDDMHQDWEIAAVQAAHEASKAGKLPASLKRMVEDMITPKADWRSILRRFFTAQSRDDYSWQRPNRKFLSMGIILPGLFSESMGEICTVIDTSGSINDEILRQFNGEISDIREQVQPEMTRVIYCDAAVNHIDEFEKYGDFKLEGHGGGGTDFRPPFDWIEKEGKAPQCLVYLTDGYGPFPDKPPGYPVLWLMTTDVTPPWGEFVRIEL